MKISHFFIRLKITIFTAVKNRSILHGNVCVMYFQLQRYCRCEYRDFPDLDTLPIHVRTLKNFAFKAIIVAVRTSLTYMHLKLKTF